MTTSVHNNIANNISSATKDVNVSEVKLVDIRDPNAKDFDLESLIVSGLEKDGQKELPTLILYDNKGLQLFDSITYLEEYYLTNCEIGLLKKNMQEILQYIPSNSKVIELGSGSLRKTQLILKSIDASDKEGVDYYALDVMESELTKSLAQIGQFDNLSTFGLWGTYDDGLRYLEKNWTQGRSPKTILWLGSSLGNLTYQENVDFLSNFVKGLNKGDRFLIGVDHCRNAKEVGYAYDDPHGVSEDFIMNGLDNINNILGYEFINRDNFSYHSVTDMEKGYHESAYKSKADQNLVYRKHNQEDVNIRIQKDEIIHVEFSFKFTREDFKDMCSKVGMELTKSWFDNDQDYSINILTKI
jgi:EasF-like predicted methyltransferase